jgi:hypothetical protein
MKTTTVFKHAETVPKAAILDHTQNESRVRTSAETQTHTAVLDVPEGSPLRVLLDWQKQGINIYDLVRATLMAMSIRIYRLSGKIDEAFITEPFDLNSRPDEAANQRRFNACVTDIARVIKLLEQFAETTSVVDEMFTKPRSKSVPQPADSS